MHTNTPLLVCLELVITGIKIIKNQQYRYKNKVFGNKNLIFVF